MCGISGQTGAHARDAVGAVRTFPYRGPDAEGSFEAPGIGFGHLRLSIIDTDARSNQPLSTADSRYTIVFNGEIYNYREIRDALRGNGVQFRTESDTEALLEGYRMWGSELLPKLRGMFAFAIYDATKREIFLARDHAGIKPLYFSVQGGELTFASEIKGVVSMLRSRGESIRIREQSVGLYLALGYVPSPLTLVDGIEKLPRSSWLRYSCDTKAIDRGTWKPPDPAITGPDGLADAVRASIVEHTIADVPVGVFFSGGIDSSVVALALRDAGINLSTYSVEVEGRAADAPYFRAIAKALGIQARVHAFGAEEFDGVFEHVLSKMDDPIADPSIFPTAFIARIAARDVKVVLSGEGGDELFLGYPRTLALSRMRAKPESWGLLDSAMLGAPSFSGKRAADAALAHALRKPVHYYLSQASLAFDLTPPDGWRGARTLLEGAEPIWYDRDSYLENMLLRKTDMATMYASIEGRVPLLGAHLWTAAPQFAAFNAQGSGKQTLRDMLRTALPNDLVDRPKSGFGIPLARLRAQSKLLAAAEATARVELPRICAILTDACHRSETNAPLSYGLVALHRSLRNLSLTP